MGEWEVVAPPPPPPLPTGEESRLKHEEGGDNNDAAQEDDSSANVQKREAEEPLEDERNFKLRRRKVDLGLGELWDPGDIPIKLKSKPNAAAEELHTESSNQNEFKGKGMNPSGPDLSSGALKLELPTVPVAAVEQKERWQSNGWKRATAPVVEDASEIYQDPLALSDPIKQEANGGTPDFDQPALTDGNETNVIADAIGSSLKAEECDAGQSKLKQEESSEEKVASIPDAPAGGLFRKRKMPAGGRGGRR
jgi:WW domain-binding protein 4